MSNECLAAKRDRRHSSGFLVCRMSLVEETNKLVRAFVMDKILVCYHGTSRESAARILSTRIYKESGADSWLGRGVYFFENDPIQAEKFVKAYRRELQDQEISVLQTNLRVAEGEAMIDLLTDEDRQFVEEYGNRIMKVIESKLKPYQRSWHHKEGYVLDFLFKKNPYVLVRAPYDIPKRKKKSGFGYSQIHVQVCVKMLHGILRNSIKLKK